MQMTRSSTKREKWLLDFGLRKFRVPKQQERALAAVILDGIALMLNVTFSTRTFALLQTLLEALAVWNALLFQEEVSKTCPHNPGIPMNYCNDASECQ
jgi:DNA-binding helix-hairpin-helix protein with protein kinase domain